MSDTPAVEVVPEETAVATRSGGRPPIPVPRDLAEQLEFAQVVLKSGLSLGHKSAESIVLALQLGSELGFTPMQALRCITVINGKPAPNADACVAAAMASDRCVYFREIGTTDKSSTWETLRKGDPEPTRYTFTMQDAEHAGLTSRGSDTWKKYPKRMLAARAKKYLAQDKYPDILGGLLSAEELHDLAGQVDITPRTQTAPIATPRRVDAPPAAADALDLVAGDEAGELRERTERTNKKRDDKRAERIAAGDIVGPLPGCVSQNQIAMLMSLCHAKGVDEAALKNHLGTAYGHESRWQIKKGDELSAIMLWVSEHAAPKSHARLVCRTRPRPGGRW